MTTKFEHHETIGTIELHGLNYEIDWLFARDNEGNETTERDTIAVVYDRGRQVAEFINPNWMTFKAEDQTFRDNAHCLELAKEFIEEEGPFEGSLG